jgi:hypothetical protein
MNLMKKQGEVIGEMTTELEEILRLNSDENSEKWKLEELAFMVMELHGFHNFEYRGKVPRKILEDIKRQRRIISRGFFLPHTIQQMEDQLDSKEIKILQSLLPPTIHNEITASIPMETLRGLYSNDLQALDIDKKRTLTKELLKIFREVFKKLEDREERLQHPFGAQLLGGTPIKKKGSQKGWPIWGMYIQNFADLFREYYPVSGRGWNKAKSKHSKGHYPHKLRVHILNYFKETFPKALGDLEPQDVTSKIQYGDKRKIQRKFFTPEERVLPTSETHLDASLSNTQTNQ